MCYHTATPEKKAIKELLDREIRIDDYKHHYHVNGYSHPEMPVMLSEDKDHVQAVSWGYIPPKATPEFAADFQKKGYSLNAKSETIFNLDIYRESAKQRRCLVFVSGFFEWKLERVNGKDVKRPYFIKMPGQNAFALGGIYSHWTEKGEDPVVTGHNILTTPANELMSSIHNTKKRMPLILDQRDWDLWLDSAADEKHVKQVMKQYPDDLLNAHPVNLSLKKGIDTDVPEVQYPA